MTWYLAHWSSRTTPRARPMRRRYLRGTGALYPGLSSRRMNAFTTRVLGRVNKPVHRLGLAVTFCMDERGFSAALERGLNYVFWGRGPRALRTRFREALRKDRERYVVAT